MYCVNCGKEVDSNAKFCGHCGRQITNRRCCTGCGAPNINNSEFCIQCGFHFSEAQVTSSRNETPAQHLATAPNTPSSPQPIWPNSSQAYSSHQPATAQTISSSNAKVKLKSPKSRIAAAILALLLGQFGVHRFYAGKKGTAGLQLMIVIAGYIIFIFSILGYALLGIVGIWVLIDFILILNGKFKDGQGLLVS